MFTVEADCNYSSFLMRINTFFYMSKDDLVWKKKKNREGLETRFEWGPLDTQSADCSWFARRSSWLDHVTGSENGRILPLCGVIIASSYRQNLHSVHFQVSVSFTLVMKRFLPAVLQTPGLEVPTDVVNLGILFVATRPPGHAGSIERRINREFSSLLK